MAKKSKIEKWKRVPKFGVRAYNRCRRCGRARAFLRKAELENKLAVSWTVEQYLALIHPQ